MGRIFFQLPTGQGIEDTAASILINTIELVKTLGHFTAFGLARGRAGICPQGQFPITGGFDDMAFFHQQQRADNPQVAVKEVFAHAHAFHAPVLAHIHEEGMHQIVGIVPKGQMAQAVVPAQFKKAFAAQPRATKAGGIALIFFRMGVGAVVCDFHMRGNAVLGQPRDQGRVTGGVKAGIHMQSHDFKFEGNDALAQMQGFEQDKTVHPTRNGNADTRTRADHVGALHGLTG